MAEQNIKMNVKTDTGYDTLYPQTKADIVSFNDTQSMVKGKTVQENLKNTVDELYHPNLLINGDFQIWQRGTNFPNSKTGGFSADRWKTYTEGQGSLNIRNSNGRMLITGNGKGRYVISQYLLITDEIKDKLKQSSRLSINNLYVTNKNMQIGCSINLINRGESNNKNIYNKIISAIGGRSIELKDSFNFDANNLDNYEFIQFNIASISQTESINNLYIYHGQLTYGNTALFYPKSYAQEYLDCCRYYIKKPALRSVKLQNTDSTKFYTTINGEFPVEMIGIPTVTYEKIMTGEGTVLSTVANFANRVNNKEITSIAFSTNQNAGLISIINTEINAEIL